MLVGVLGAAFVVGPEVTDYAWDHGMHVTPAQAALHDLLMAQGITHHHNPVATKRAADPVEQGVGDAVEAPSTGFTFGTVLGQVVVQRLDVTPLDVHSALVTAGQSAPTNYIGQPPTPPPELV